MELLRQTIRTLFFLQKTTTVIRKLVEEKKNLDTSIDESWFVRVYMDDTGDIRTKDQIEEVYRLAESKWMKPDKDIHYMSFADKSIFNSLLHFTSSVLIERKDVPVCKYGHVLRWNDLTLDLGEDMFTTAYLASKDVLQNRERRFFSWPDIIGHDNATLNQLFEKPMIDLHYHLYGSSFVFDLNWLSLMNDMTNRKNTFNEVIKDYLKSVHVVNSQEDLKSIYELVMIAAAIRLYLFSTVVLRKDDAFLWNLVCRILKAKCELDFDSLCPSLCDKQYSQRQITGHRFHSLHNDFASVIDYAMVNSIVPTQDTDNSKVFSVLAGERNLMYSVFRDIYANHASPNIATLFYVYLLIKTEFRKEMVQMNVAVGFSNFQDYQNRKYKFIKAGSIYEEVFDQVAIRSSLSNNQRYLEARVTPKDTKERIAIDIESIDQRVKKGFLANDSIPDITSHYDYILHFIKVKDDKYKRKADKDLFCRHYKLRNKIKKQSFAIKEYVTNCINLQKNMRVVGIDAASSEMACRPEVFGQAYRFLKYYKPRRNYNPNIKELGFTYHVGEDFLDVVDGLRAVDEALLFLHLGNGDRIGHGLVLGVDVEKYYKKRSHYVSLPKQVLLDNIVWLYYKGSTCDGFNKVVVKLKSLYEKYYREIYEGNNNKYSHIPTIYDYYQSWLLRGDDPERYRNTNSPINDKSYSYWDMYALNDVEEVKEARKNQTATSLYHRYHCDGMAYDRGTGSEQIKLDDDLMHVISQVQENLLCEIERRHIAIETNPTSNYRIGDFNRYDEHPILRFFNYNLNYENYPSHSITVSINTDDKGVFSTSLEREYSVMSAALEKKNDVSKGIYPPRAIYDWLDRIRIMGFESRFGQ